MVSSGKGGQEVLMSKLSELYLILTLRCRQATELASQSIDEPLALGKKIAFYGHLMICLPCRRFYEQLHVLRSNADALDESDDHVCEINDYKLSPNARQRISEAIQESLNARHDRPSTDETS